MKKVNALLLRLMYKVTAMEISQAACSPLPGKPFAYTKDVKWVFMTK